MNMKGLWQHLLTLHQETAPSLGSEHKVCSLCVVHWCMPSCPMKPMNAIRNSMAQVLDSCMV